MNNPFDLSNRMLMVVDEQSSKTIESSMWSVIPSIVFHDTGSATPMERILEISYASTLLKLFMTDVRT